jgi:hypothetical protein
MRDIAEAILWARMNGGQPVIRRRVYSLNRRSLVPKKGLEPPHPCEYMDLNHARLPIPPLRHDRIQRDWLDRQQQLVYKRRG